MIKYGRHSKVLIFEKKVKKIYKKELYSNFLKEIEALQKLKNFSFIPKLYNYDKNELFIEIEKAEGKTLLEIIKLYKKGIIKKDTIIKILKIILKICFIMDIESVYKDEWTRPFKHVIICKENIKIIDFDRCQFYSQKKNINQFLSFYFNFFKISNDKKIIKKQSEFFNFQIDFYKNFNKGK